MSPDRFDLSSFGLAPHFPATRLESGADFVRFQREQRALLDTRYGYEQGLATRGAELVRPGTCAPCLRPTVFRSSTAQGEKLADGRLVPNWRETMRCDCIHGLINRQRALLHFMQVVGLPSWAHVLLFGPPSAADAYVSQAVKTVTAAPRLLRSLAAGSDASAMFHLPVETDAVHVAVSQDYLHAVPPLGAALSELCRVLMPGGSFIFTVPFHLTNAQSTPAPADVLAEAGDSPAEFWGGVRSLGWDLLDQLRAAGFRDAAAYCYWSEELGYLGPFNLVFRAVK
jgi:hypothetical protein